MFALVVFAAIITVAVICLSQRPATAKIIIPREPFDITEAIRFRRLLKTRR